MTDVNVTPEAVPPRRVYADVADLLKHGIPDPPAPTVLRRDDGTGMFYRAQVNMLFGEPETGKTWVALAAVADALNHGGKAAVIDLDHNGVNTTVRRLIDLQCSPESLGNQDVFRYAAPDDKGEVLFVAQDLAQWHPNVVVLDSMGELMAALGLNSNSPDDFTIAHTVAMKPLMRAGICLIVLDHESKAEDSGKRGPTGTAAKKRVVGGSMLRVTIKDGYSPGRGGASYLTLHKDRNGGLRAATEDRDPKPLAGTFVMHASGAENPFSVYAPREGERAPGDASGADVAAVANLDPAPESVEDVRQRMGWRKSRAADALRAYRAQESTINGPQDQAPKESGSRYPHIGAEPGTAPEPSFGSRYPEPTGTTEPHHADDTGTRFPPSIPEPGTAPNKQWSEPDLFSVMEPTEAAS